MARNGTVIEQSQVLTTHNLAPLVGGLGLADRLQPRAADLAGEVFDWIVRQQTTPRPGWRPQLRMIKNTAYAWRQAIFLLSLVDPPHQREALAHLRASVGKRPAEWQRRFAPAADGLAAVIDGGRFGVDGRLGSGRRFLGWSVGRHWLLPPQPARGGSTRR